MPLDILYRRCPGGFESNLFFTLSRKLNACGEKCEFALFIVLFCFPQKLSQGKKIAYSDVRTGNNNCHNSERYSVFHKGKECYGVSVSRPDL